MKLADLIVMQENLRDAQQITGMISYVQQGGRWTDEATKAYSESVGRSFAPIYLARFPDGILMVHDGHHRTLATYMAGRESFDENEYLICDWTYEAYDSIFFERGYVTPHDPRTEVRLQDFAAFKLEALQMAKTDEKAAIAFIHANKARYAKKRTVTYLPELAAKYTELCP